MVTFSLKIVAPFKLFTVTSINSQVATEYIIEMNNTDAGVMTNSNGIAVVDYIGSLRFKRANILPSDAID